MKKIPKKTPLVASLSADKPQVAAIIKEQAQHSEISTEEVVKDYKGIFSSENTICINCGSENVHVHGYEKMRYKCIECNKTFFAGPSPIANKYYEVKIIQLKLEGLTNSQIVNLLRVARKTVNNVYIKYKDFFDEVLDSSIIKKRKISELKELEKNEPLKKERIRIDEISKRIFVEDNSFRTSGLIITRHKHARFEVHTEDRLLTVFIVERNNRQSKIRQE